MQMQYWKANVNKNLNVYISLDTDDFTLIHCKHVFKHLSITFRYHFLNKLFNPVDQCWCAYYLRQIYARANEDVYLI